MNVVVTGVSSGIGLGIAQGLTRAGWRVFGSVRRAEDGERLRRALGDRLVPLVLDVCDEPSLHEAARRVADALGPARLAGLVNNAGMVLAGPLLEQPLEEIELQLTVNLMGPLRVTRAFAPLLGVDPARTGSPGRVINISSVGGRIASPFIGAYAASKHGLEGLSESLRRELMLYGIDVIVVAPGSVRTEIWGKARAASDGRYPNSVYAHAMERFREYTVQLERAGLSPEEVGEVVRHALTTRRPSTRYAVVPGRLLNWTLPRLLPPRLLDRLIASQLELRPRGARALRAP